jgi:hypothetical protein
MIHQNNRKAASVIGDILKSFVNGQIRPGSDKYGYLDAISSIIFHNQYEPLQISNDGTASEGLLSLLGPSAGGCDQHVPRTTKTKKQPHNKVNENGDNSSKSTSLSNENDVMNAKIDQNRSSTLLNKKNYSDEDDDQKESPEDMDEDDHDDDGDDTDH